MANQNYMRNNICYQKNYLKKKIIYSTALHDSRDQIIRETLICYIRLLKKEFHIHLRLLKTNDHFYL